MFQSCFLHDGIGHLPRQLVNRVSIRNVLLYFTTFIYVYDVPTDIENALVSQPIKDAITPKDDEVMVFTLYYQLRYFRLSNCYSLLASVLRQLGLNISNCSWNWESAWHYSMRPQHYLLLSLVSLIVCNHLHIGGLVHLTSILCYSSFLKVIIWAMVPRKQE
jgi:hypothetical protein